MALSILAISDDYVMFWEVAMKYLLLVHHNEDIFDKIPEGGQEQGSFG